MHFSQQAYKFYSNSIFEGDYCNWSLSDGKKLDDCMKLKAPDIDADDELYLLAQEMDTDGARDHLRTVYEDIGCFPAGTRIMTNKGIVPIEQIKVGDKVLSKPEDGTGEPAFKPVVRTVSHKDKKLWDLTYVEIKPNTDISKLTASKLKQLSMKRKFSTMAATPNHPFWVEGVGWTRLDHLEYGQIIHSKKEKMRCMVFDVSPEYATNIDNVAAQSSIRNILDADKKGQEIEDTEYYGFPRYGDDGYVKEFLGGGDAPSPLITAEYGEIVVSNNIYTTTVYNFEVADYHTYYVWDLWVHNINCDGRADVAKKEDLVR